MKANGEVEKNNSCLRKKNDTEKRDVEKCKKIKEKRIVKLKPKKCL